MSQIKKNILQRGFTLIELLVVIAIIGLLASIITASLNISRIKARDAARVSTMKQIKTGLDLYFSSGSGYPTKATWDGNVGKNISCGTTNTVTVPTDPASPTYSYTYTDVAPSSSGCGGTVMAGYTIQFYMENKSAYYTMDQDGTVRNAGGTVVSWDSLLK